MTERSVVCTANPAFLQRSQVLTSLPLRKLQSSDSITPTASEALPAISMTSSQILTPHQDGMPSSDNVVFELATKRNDSQPIVTPAMEEPRRSFPKRQGQESNKVAVVKSKNKSRKYGQKVARLGVLPIGRNGRLRIVTSDTSRKGNRIYTNIAFPNVLYDMILEHSVSSPDVMHWIQDGSAFQVDSNNRSLKKILPQYFGRTFNCEGQLRRVLTAIFQYCPCFGTHISSCSLL